MKVFIKVKAKDFFYFERKFVEHNICYNVNKKLLDKYIISLSLDDYEKVKLYDYNHNIDFYKEYSLKFFLNCLKKNIERIIITLFIIILVISSSHMIFKVNINTSDKKLKTLVKYALLDEDIAPYKMSKSFRKTILIKNKILKKFNQEIEWMEIEKNGSIYNIYIIKKVTSKKNTSSDKCNYVAKKSGLITSTYVQKGVLLVQENNYIKKGDILISGQIIYNEELKKEICAKGKVFGEVWYKVDASYPLEKKDVKYKEKKFVNVYINFFGKKYKLFADKYDTEKLKKSIGGKNFGIDLTKSYKRVVKLKKYSNEKALKKAMEKAHEALLIRLPKNAKIVDEKVLKKSIINGKIYVEVLLTTNEELGVVENY